jgi:hypothetical protein
LNRCQGKRGKKAKKSRKSKSSKAKKGKKDKKSKKGKKEETPQEQQKRLEREEKQRSADMKKDEDKKKRAMMAKAKQAQTYILRPFCSFPCCFFLTKFQDMLKHQYSKIMTTPKEPCKPFILGIL